MFRKLEANFIQAGASTTQRGPWDAGCKRARNLLKLSAV